MLNSEYNDMLQWKARGTVLAGIVEKKDILAGPSKYIPAIREIVGGHLEPHNKHSYFIADHWVLYDKERNWWGVYYKPGYDCYITTLPRTKTFYNDDKGDSY